MSLKRIPGNEPDAGKSNTQGIGLVPAPVLARCKVYGLAVLLGLTIALYGLIVAHHDGGDFASLYLADARLLNDRPIYWAPPEIGPSNHDCPVNSKGIESAQLKTLPTQELINLPTCFHPNLNPPVFILLTAPLAWLSFQSAWMLWFCLSLACLAGSVEFIRREQLIPGGTVMFCAVSQAFLLYVPTLASFFLGQVTFQVMLAVVLGWRALRHGRDWAAGAWLGLAVSVKPFVGLLAVGLFLLGNKRALMAMLLAGLACGALGWLAGGWEAYRDYLEALRTISWQAASWNTSFAGFFSRPLGGSRNIPWIDAPAWARGLTDLAALAVLVTYALSIRRLLALSAAPRADWLLALSLPAMLLISPLGWLYYFPLLLLTALGVWRAGGAMKQPRRFRAALVATLVLSSIPSGMISAKHNNDPLDWFGATGFYTVALAQLFVLAVMAARQQIGLLQVNDPAAGGRNTPDRDVRDICPG